MIDLDTTNIATHEFTGEEIGELLLASVKQMKQGEFAKVVSIPSTIRQEVGLSQSQFAKALGISVNTLKSWEQGQRQPSGSARVLLTLLARRPELIKELAT
ncbi:helix-turn-helix domain-containing protein [Moraxella nasovis]|uniref:helix-turn-helix domain-containing protein n=1 Tax=Moraxella nasovis TaxID=2904121 RepID=UPI001F614B0C|nr:helix-turn-helix domain-containing protein [Moraxella nasovis]UNU72944.1 helix-turn-helix domain-containing protein [Moraxella nasovis]